MTDLLLKTLELIPNWAKHTVNRPGPILIGLRGSAAHGTKLEHKENSIDDTDVFVVVKHPREYYLSLGYLHQREQHWERAGANIDLDIVVYDVVKLLNLLEQANPNVLNWLWNRPQDYMHMDWFGKQLVENREIFLSQVVFKRLVGYANGQLNKALNENKKYQGYMGEKRKSLVDQHGYDIKNMAHCYRLIMMALELLEHKTFNSYRPEKERNVIKAIKNGEYTLQSINALIHEKFEVYENLKEKYINDFRKAPDRAAVNKLMLSILDVPTCGT